MMFLNDNLEKSSLLSEITIPIGQIREIMRNLFRLLWRGDGSAVRGDVPERLPGEGPLTSFRDYHSYWSNKGDDEESVLF